VRDTPISEAAIIGAAMGAAAAGLRPVAEIMIMDFIGIALDQLVNGAAKLHYMTSGKLKAPLTLRTSVTARFGAGATHSQSLEAWLMHIPGLKVAMPSTPFDAKGMLTTCILDDDPCVFIEDACLYQRIGQVPAEPYSIPVGEAEVKATGSDVTLITYGWLTHECLAVAEQLAGDGISVEVVDLRWLLPLDTDTILATVEKTGRAVIVHAATRFAGPGAEIAALVNEELFGRLAAPVQRVAAPFVPIPAAPVMEQVYFPSQSAITEAVKATLA
jgi:pyruvate dehydrogenase E1 component beta subunit